MFARKISVEIITPPGPADSMGVSISEERKCPIAWLDSYSMRSFTGRSAFDETLPIGEGLMEAGFAVELEALRTDMEDWLTRKFGSGRPVRLHLTEIARFASQEGGSG